MNNLTASLISLGLCAWIYAFYISFKHFKNKKFPVMYHVREYTNGVLTAEYQEISGYKEMDDSPPHLKVSPQNSGEIKEEPGCYKNNSQAPPDLKKIGRPPGAKNKIKNTEAAL